MASQNLVSFLRFPALLAILLASMAAAIAADVPTYKGGGEPLHPSAITKQHDGKLAPVVSVSGSTPEIELDGKRMGVAKDASYTFARLASFGPGSIKILRHEIARVENQFRNPDGVVVNELSGSGPVDEYQATLVSDTDHPNAFLVVVIFQRDFLSDPTAAPNTALFFKQLGALTANDNKKVVVELGRFAPEARQRLEFFPLVFANGRELRSQLDELSAAYFRQVEMVRHTSVLENYLRQNANSDHAIQPYVRIAPILPEGTSNSVATKLNVRLTIDAKGIVNQAEVLGEVPGPIKTEVERAFRGWLFLPKITKGKPVAAKAVVPLQVSLPAS